MQLHNLVGKSGRRHRRKAKMPQSIATNLQHKNIYSYNSNELWCADITELRCKDKRLYLSGIIDVGTRRIIGWDIQSHMRQDIVHNAIAMAVGRNPQRKGTIFHSDQGCQYTSHATKELLEKNSLKRSKSKAGRPNDNQVIESFWKTLKLELDVKNLKAEQAKRVIVQYIELEYNSTRLHSSIGYMTPNEKHNENLSP